jgi:aspartyl-tRNA(Asn)/glutamyl-tRNA(Gln) amidotransferase subunit B
MGHPGTLPLPNEEAIKKVLKAGKALKCTIPEYSKFDRKNYFYPDLPKGYQISQYDMPLCEGGELEIVAGGKKKTVHLERIHLEEDTGKLFHAQGGEHSLVDFNRAGVPLMELVTKPNLHSAIEAVAFARELQLIFQYIDISDADMEKGNMRLEANISVSPNENELGTKVEVKNLNSFRALGEAIEYELKRHEMFLREGEKIVQETRGWNADEKKTYSQREKEEAKDYRYFPDPDIPPLHVGTQEYLSRITLPELPSQKRERFSQEYGIERETVELFITRRDLGSYYEKVMSELRNWIKEKRITPSIEEEEFHAISKLCANYATGDLLGLLGDLSVQSEHFQITPENFAEFVSLRYEDKMSSPIAKKVLEKMFLSGADPSHIIEEEGFSQISDEKELETIIQDILSKNAKAVEDFKKGKGNAMQFLVGQIMAKTKGSANPDKAREVLLRELSKEK